MKDISLHFVELVEIFSLSEMSCDHWRSVGSSSVIEVYGLMSRIRICKEIFGLGIYMIAVGKLMVP